MNALRAAGGKVGSCLGEALRGRRIVPPILTLILLAGSVLLSPSLAVGDFVSNGATASGYSKDDYNTSTLNPYPLIPISSITYAGHPELSGQCVWINSALNAFIAANPANGTGPSHTGWSYQWAGVAQEAAVEKGLSLVPYTNQDTEYSGYNPYVVDQPSVTAANGKNYSSDHFNAEGGGAVLNIQYTQGGASNAPPISDLNWIQAYTGTIYGKPFGPILDNDFDHPYSAQSSVSPYYNTKGAAGSLIGGGWFLDTPYVPEDEYESNPVVSVQFQVVLASEKQTVLNGVTQNNITLYGGYWWGFTYSAVDTPEPASVTLLGIGAFGLVGYGWRRRKRAAA